MPMTTIQNPVRKVILNDEEKTVRRYLTRKGVAKGFRIRNRIVAAAHWEANHGYRVRKGRFFWRLVMCSPSHHGAYYLDD